jgi:hypothetical protein
MDTPFIVGDVVSDGHPSNSSSVDITVSEILDNGDLKAKVTGLGRFYSNERNADGFSLGEDLYLKRMEDASVGRVWWIISKPENRPWHILSVRDGNKIFEHYR